MTLRGVAPSSVGVGLGAGGPVIAGVRDISLGRWREDWRPEWEPASCDSLRWSGVPWTVAEAMSVNAPVVNPNLSQEHLAYRAWWALLCLAALAPELSLSAATGWVLTYRASDREWLVPEFYETGWLFAAAGLSVDEARAVLASGKPVPVQGLRALAALRGVTLPA
jgi:hypothetical protein